MGGSSEQRSESVAGARSSTPESATASPTNSATAAAGDAAARRMAQREQTESVLGYTSLAAGGVLLAAAPFTAGATGVVGMILIGASGVATVAGVAGIEMQLRDRIEREGGLHWDKETALDLVQLVTMAASGGLLSNALKSAGTVARGLKLLTLGGLNTAQAALLSSELHDAIAAIEQNYEAKIKATPDQAEALRHQRNHEIAALLGQAAVNGAFLLVGTAAMVREAAHPSANPPPHEIAPVPTESELIARLERGEDVPIPHGQTSAAMMREITAKTGREVALLRHPHGQRFLRLGDGAHVNVGDDVKVIAHTHPNGAMELSGDDDAALAVHGQHSSVVVTPDDAQRLRSHGAPEQSGDAHQLSEPDPRVDEARKKAFADTKQPHPEREKYHLHGETNFHFKSADQAQWPAQLTQFLADQFGVAASRLKVVQFGGGKSGDFVFGVFLDHCNLGVLKLFHDPNGAATEARILHSFDAAHLEHFNTPKEMGRIGDVSLDGSQGSAMLEELVPGQSLEQLIKSVPKGGPEREAHIKMLEQATRNVAASYSEMHTKMASGELVGDTHKQNEVRMILRKMEMARDRNNQSHRYSDKFLADVDRRLREEIVPKFMKTPLPATVYHGDAQVGNVVIDQNLQSRPIDLLATAWSYDNQGHAKQTGAVDVGSFIAQLYEKCSQALRPEELDRIARAFLDEYFKGSKVSSQDLSAGVKLYGIDTQLGWLAYDPDNHPDAIPAIAHMLDLKP